MGPIVSGARRRSGGDACQLLDVLADGACLRKGRRVKAGEGVVRRQLVVRTRSDERTSTVRGRLALREGCSFHARKE